MTKGFTNFVNGLSWMLILGFVYICMALLIERAATGKNASVMAAVDAGNTSAPMRPVVDQTVRAENPEPVKQESVKPKPVATEEDKVKNVYARLILEDQPKLAVKTAKQWAEAMLEEEKKYDLPKGLVLAITHTESWHDPKAVSSAGALGLMQVMMPTAKDFAPKVGVWQAPAEKKLPEKASWTAKNKAQKAFEAESKKAEKRLVAKLHEPASNIKVGAKVLATYVENERGNLPRALKKYSCGATDYHKKVSEYRKVVLAKLKSEAASVE